MTVQLLIPMLDLRANSIKYNSRERYTLSNSCKDQEILPLLLLLLLLLLY